MSNKKHNGENFNVKWSVKKLFYLFLIVVFCTFSLVACAELESPESSVGYDICATFDVDSHSLTGELSLDYVYKGESTLTSLTFSLHPNRYMEGALKVDNVYVDGSQVGFSIVNKTYMEVALPYELFGGDKVSVVINWTLEVVEGDGIFGYSERDVRLSGWYPVLCVLEDEWCTDEGRWGDYLFSECADYTVRLTVSDKVTVASSGKRIMQTNSDDTVTYTYEGKNMRDFAFAISERFSVVSGVCGSTLVSAYGFDEKGAQSMLVMAQRALFFYNERYGNYPYPTYSVCSTKLKEGGMEFSGLVYVNDTLIDTELEEVVAHETAHQWWYGVLGSSPIKYAWLDEGLTEYSTLCYMSSRHGEEWYNTKVTKSHQAYASLCDVEIRLNNRCDIPMSQSTTLYRSSYEYAMVTYVKGMLFFENLNSITNGKLDLALREYYRDFAYGIVTPENLRLIVEKKSKLNLIGFFDAWEGGKVVFCY